MDMIEQLPVDLQLIVYEVGTIHIPGLWGMSITSITHNQGCCNQV